MDNIKKINNIRLNSKQIISAITEYIIVSCLDFNNINSILNDFEYWLETTQVLNNKIRELTNVSKFEVSDQDMFKIITSCISFYYPNLNQMMNKIMEEYLKFDDKERNISALMNFQRINILYFGGKLEVRDLINRVLNVGLAEA